MKIIQINAVYGEKSTGVIVKDIHMLLKSEGHQSYVAYPARKEQTNEEIQIGTTIDWKYHALYSRITGMQGLASKGATKVFLGELNDIKPDIIHLHNIHSNYLNYTMLFRYAAEHDIPIILTLHDCWYFTGKCYHFLDIKCEKWKRECVLCPKKNMDIPNYFIDNSLKVFRLRKQLYDANDLFVVGCSQWITDCAGMSPLFENASVLRIYNGVDTNIFTPDAEHLKKEFNIEGNFIIITMANKWFDVKNQSVRIALLNYLDKNDKILVIGCSEGQIESNKQKQIITVGYVKNRHYLAQLYASGDMFLNLTFVDTLPTVNMEAASCGVPVVTYDSGGSGELVQDGITGYVVEQENTEQLLKAIYNIKKGLINRNNCRKWAIKKFDKNVNYKQYLDLYEKILQCREKEKY